MKDLLPCSYSCWLKRDMLQHANVKAFRVALSILSADNASACDGLLTCRESDAPSRTPSTLVPSPSIGQCYKQRNTLWGITATWVLIHTHTHTHTLKHTYANTYMHILETLRGMQSLQVFCSCSLSRVLCT